MNSRHLPKQCRNGDTARLTECGKLVPANLAPTVLYHAGPERFAAWEIIETAGKTFDLRCPDCNAISREKYNDLPARIGSVPTSAQQRAAIERQNADDDVTEEQQEQEHAENREEFAALGCTECQRVLDESEDV